MSKQHHYQPATDMLRSIFAMQAQLNDRVFDVNGLRDNDGVTLSMQAIAQGIERQCLGVNDLPNTWLAKYAKAMDEEIRELNAELLWKWWSKDSIDVQNIRVELVDILHFLVSAMICAGLTPEKVFDVYCQKHGVNLKRQDSGYSKSTKTEDDNRAIK